MTEAQQIAEWLRRILAGDVRIGWANRGGWIDDGVCTLRAGECRIRFFIDAGDLNYVDAVETSDGKVLRDFATDPLDLLAADERAAFETLLKRVEPWH
jgi:hypothetical protein